jgi:transposase
VRLQLRIKSELYCFGIEFPAKPGPWSQTFVSWLWRLRLTDRWQTESFQKLLLAYEQLSGLIAAQTRLLKELALTERYRAQVELLMTVPGIGLLTAMEILLELGDLKRFRNGRKLAAYVGLTPGQYSSGERVRLGRISKIGKAQLRASLIEASWILIRKSVAIEERYQLLKVRCGGKRAIVAIARKLLLMVRRMLLDHCRYQPQAA